MTKYAGCGRPIMPERIFPDVVHVLAKRPDVADLFPVGTGLADWVLWSA